MTYKIPQWRPIGCTAWHDGYPDASDHIQVETRVLYTSDTVQQERRAAEITMLEQEARQMWVRNERLEEELRVAKLNQQAAEEDAAGLESMLTEARENDLTSASYLSGIRDALGFVGDFPALVEHCKALKGATQ